MKTVLTVVVLLILGALRLFEYRHRDYIKIRDDYEPTKTNPTGDRNDGCGSK